MLEGLGSRREREMTDRTDESPTSERSWARRPWAVASGLVLTVAAAGQVVLTLVFYDSAGVNDVVANVGWVVLWASGVFGVVPMYTLRRHGGVPDGRSYVHTTVLVDRGIYAIVRHPQYLAGILLSLGLSLVAQHGAVVLLGAVVALLSYLSTFDEENDLRDRFGADYDAYCRRVPRINAATGLVRHLRRTR